MLYLLDANVLIRAHEDYYPIDRVPQFWQWLHDTAVSGQAKVPFEIFDEIAISTGPLELERRKAEIAERIAQAPADLPDVHPNVANIYRAKVATFTEVLDDPDGGATAADAIRSLIGAVVLRPGPKRGQIEAELRGELMGILDFTESSQNQRIGKVRTNAVAGPRNTETAIISTRLNRAGP